MADSKQVAVVTGAGSGLGLGLARGAARRGMTVVAADVDAGRLEAAGIEGAHLVPTDVTRWEDVERLADVAFGLGEVALVCNNAGISELGLLWEQDPAVWHRILDVNVDGVYHGIRAFVPRLLAAGRPARVVNTASVGGFGTGVRHGVYQVSKHAVIALSQCLAAELADVGAPVRVAVVCPASIATRIFVDAGGDGGEVARMRDLLATEGMAPDDAADLVLDQVAAGRFWVSPHPDHFVASVGRRIDVLDAARASFADAAAPPGR